MRQIKFERQAYVRRKENFLQQKYDVKTLEDQIHYWRNVTPPNAFGRNLSPEEQYIVYNYETGNIPWETLE